MCVGYFTVIDVKASDGTTDDKLRRFEKVILKKSVECKGSLLALLYRECPSSLVTRRLSRLPAIKMERTIPVSL